MEITICNHRFDSREIRNITFNANNTKIFVDTNDDFFVFNYKFENEVIEAKQWIRLQTLSMKELNEAITTIMSVCNYFINTNSQCSLCPIKRNKGCLFETIPINWK